MPIPGWNPHETHLSGAGNLGKRRQSNIYAENEGVISRMAMQEKRSWDSMVNVLLSEALEARTPQRAKKAAKVRESASASPSPAAKPTQQQQQP